MPQALESGPLFAKAEYSRVPINDAFDRGLVLELMRKTWGRVTLFDDSTVSDERIHIVRLCGRLRLHGSLSFDKAREF